MNPLHAFAARSGCVGHLAVIGLWLLADLLFRGASAATVTTSMGAAAAATRSAAPVRAPGPHKWASSLPSAAPKRHVMTSLSYEELGRQIGERMLITTVYGQLRDVRIEAYSSHEILVRVSVVGGYATQHILRSQIRSIRDPQ